MKIKSDGKRVVSKALIPAVFTQSAIRIAMLLADTIQVLSATQARQMKEFAERAQASLARFSSAEVSYDATGLQLLDEWVDRHLRQFPNPSPNVLTVWGAFLGETFRQRLNGEWVIDKASGKSRLGILVPKGEHNALFIDVMDQVDRRTKGGIAESLAYYYTIKSIEAREE